MTPREITFPCEHSRRDAERAREIREGLDMALLDPVGAGEIVQQPAAQMPGRMGSTEAAVALLRTARIEKGDA